MQDTDNINDQYFDGYYKDIWKAIIPDILTGREIDFLCGYFALKEGDTVLDLMCGYGRHALALGRKGIHVTAVDNLPSYIGEIEAQVEKERLPIEVVQSNAVEYRPEKLFNVAMVMGNSLNFFDAKNTLTLFKMVASALKPGGFFLINSWSVAEIAFRSFKEAGESAIEDKTFATVSKVLFHPSRIETESTITGIDGNKEVKIAIDYIYSINELEQMLNQAGMLIKDLFSIPGKKQFTIGEPRLYLVAQKQ